METAPDTQRLRPEAGPLTWDRLQGGQQEAVRRLVHLLDDALGKLARRRYGKPGSVFSRTHAQRHSSHAFISGTRGSGKTSVMVSLAALCGQSHLNVDPICKPEISPRTAAALSRIQSSAIWLDPIDIDPLPPAFNFLAAVLVRIEEAIRLAEEKHDLHLSDALQGRRSSQFAALNALTELQTNMCLAWDSNLLDRRGTLEPRVYADETIEMARANVSLAVHFQSALDQVAEEIFAPLQPHGSTPLFVLPVDDTDMNPSVGLSLLRLLRSVSTPRLFVLLMGDAKMLELVANLAMIDDLGLSALLSKEKLIPLDHDTAMATVGAITATNLRKVLPLQQRVTVEPWDLSEGMRYRPPSGLEPTTSEHASSHVTRSMAHLMLQVPVQIDSRAIPDYEKPEKGIVRISPSGGTSMLEFLLEQPINILATDTRREDKDKAYDQEPGRRLEMFVRLQATKSGEISKRLKKIAANKEIARCPYFARHIFATSPRRLADGWFAYRWLADHVERLKTDKTDWVQSGLDSWRRGVQVVVEQCRQALLEEPVFTPDDRQAIEACLDSTQNGILDWSEMPLYPRPIRGNTWRIDWSADAMLPEGEESFDEKSTNEIEVEGNKISVPGVHDGMGLEFEAYQITSWSFGSQTAREALSASRRARDRMEVSSAPDQPFLVSRRVSDDAAAHAVLLHDLLQFCPNGDNFVPVFTEAIENAEHPFAITRWRGGPNRTVEYPWPCPPCVSLFGWDLFRDAWSRAASYLGSRVDSSDLLNAWFYAWVSAGNSVMACIEPDPLPKGGEVGRCDEPGGNEAWSKLRAHTAFLCRWLADTKNRPQEANNPVARNIRQWLARVIALLMPEYGLASCLRSYFLFSTDADSVALREFGNESPNAKAISRARAEFFAAMLFRRQRRLTKRLLIADPRLCGNILAVSSERVASTYSDVRPTAERNVQIEVVHRAFESRASQLQVTPDFDLSDPEIVRISASGGPVGTVGLTPSIDLINEVLSRKYGSDVEGL